MDGFLKQIQGFGIPRLVALGGVTAGVAAVLAAILLHLGGEPQALLYSNLDPKEASQVTAALDQAGVKYELKGDGTSITVPRDKVASSRLLVAGKGLVTQGSVGYEIFDSAPSLGQTDFVQHLNQQRALEGELARTINAIQGVSAAKVLLNMPKKQLFQDDADADASASIMVTTGGRRLSAEQVKAVRNLVAGAVPGLKPERVAIADQQGELLAATGQDGIAAETGEKADVENRIRQTVVSMLDGVVGPGHARVQVSADVDMNRVTTSEEKFDPDGQVVRSTQTSEDKSKESRPGANGAVSASQNIPGAAAAGASANDSSEAGKTDETTNYEISKTTRTEVQEPGQVKKLSISVAVDGVTGPPVKGKPGAYTPRSPEEMARIEQLVKGAVGFDPKRGDQVTVLNVRFDPGADALAAAASASPLDGADLMRIAELVVMLAVAAMLILFVVRPLIKPGAAGGLPALAGVGQLQPMGGGGAAALAGPGGAALLTGPGGADLDQKIDIARIEGQVKATSVKKVADFVSSHPEESVSILRSWLHETG
ncbi:MAG: flagellar M-ring protein FliF [Caulobacteraceae bacterium]|nr:flagellar M-ring protein FliF [Caulobacter sp.]